MRGEIQSEREFFRVSAVQSVTNAMDLMKAVRTFVMNELVDGHDFGTIPGAGDRKVLLQPGAQKVLAFYEAYPDQVVEKTELGGGHVEFVVTTNVLRFQGAQKIGSGIGSCSTMESKYRFRNGKANCPKCGAEAINKSKNEPGWYCWKKQNGCGATFGEKDPAIIGQKVGKVENENPHDVRNTVLKMACKRSLVAASLALGCVSDLFTQDLDDTFDLTAVPSSGNSTPPAPDDRFTKFLAERSKETGRDWEKAAAAWGEKKKLAADPNAWTKAQKDAFVEHLEARLAKEQAQAQPEAPKQEAPREDAGDKLTQVLERAVDDANRYWDSEESGRAELGYPDGDKLIANIYQLRNHLVKWAVATSLISEPAKKDPATTRAVLAEIYPKHKLAIETEVDKYIYETLQLEKRAAKETAQAEPGELG